MMPGPAADMDIDVGSLALDGKELDLKKRVIDLDRIRIVRTKVAMRDYAGGKPKSAKQRAEVIDTTAFNPGGWVVRVRDFVLDKCALQPDILHQAAR